MPRYLKHLCVAMVALIIALPALAAPQFGKLEVRSKLGQPLRAAIVVSGLDGQPFDVAIASAADHQRYGMELPLLPDDAALSLGPLRKGVREVLLTTGLPASEPVLSMVLRFTNGSGGGTRVFTALVNPERPRALALRTNRRAERSSSVLAAVPGVQGAGATAAAANAGGDPASTRTARPVRSAVTSSRRDGERPTASTRSGRAPITRANVRERLAELTLKVEKDARERAALRATNKDLSARMKAMGERLARMQATLKRQDERLEAMRAGLQSINEKLAAAPQLALVGGAVASAQGSSSAAAAVTPPSAASLPGNRTVASQPVAPAAVTAAAAALAQPAGPSASTDLFGVVDSTTLVIVALAIGCLLLFAVLVLLLLRLNKRKARTRRAVSREQQEREAREAMSRKAASQAAPALAEPSTFKVSPNPIEELTLESNSDSMFGEPVSAIPTSGGPPAAASATAADEIAALLAEVDVRVAFGDADVAERLLTDGLERNPGEPQLEERLARVRAESGASTGDDDDWISGPDDDPFDWENSDDDSNVVPFARRG
ncbi:MAG: hypothetical protein AAF458_09390 [Pseudomonadota bacterium]